MQSSAGMSFRRSLVSANGFKGTDDFVDNLSLSAQFRKDAR